MADTSPPLTVGEDVYVFHPLDAQIKEREGLIAPPSGGVRRVNKKWLRKCPEPAAVASLSLEETCCVPVYLFSKQAYEYCGFTPDAAQELWDTYKKFEHECPDYPDLREPEHFLSFALTCIDLVPEPPLFDDDEWRTALTAMGLESALRDAIMLEEFADIRRTEGACYWAKDTVEVNFLKLQDIKRKSWERAKQGSGSTQRAGREPRPSVEEREAGVAVESAAEAPLTAPRSIVLWRGTSKHRTHGLFHADGIVDDFYNIRSPPPSDFSNFGSYYFAVDKEVALRYMKWSGVRADARGHGHEAVLLRLEVANDLIEPLKAPVLASPSDLWKEFVWNCRRIELPRRLSWLAAETLLIGHTASGRSEIASLRDWKDITVNHTLRKSDGEIATQYCFGGRTGREFLNEHCRENLVMYKSDRADKV